MSHTSIDDSNYDNDEFDNLSVSKSLGNIGLGLGASKQAKFGTHTMGDNKAFLLGQKVQPIPERKKSIGGGGPSSSGGG